MNLKYEMTVFFLSRIESFQQLQKSQAGLFPLHPLSLNFCRVFFPHQSPRFENVLYLECDICCGCWKPLCLIPARRSSYTDCSSLLFQI